MQASPVMPIEDFAAKWEERLFKTRYEFVAQLLRFIATGAFLTVLYAVVYSIVIGLSLSMAPTVQAQLANLTGYLVAMVLGYIIHSRWSFRGYGTRSNVARMTVRFFIVSLVSLALNAGWTWIIASHFGLEKHLPLIPISFVTPLVTFSLNRKWVFI